jgi:hypothetical protein
MHDSTLGLDRAVLEPICLFKYVLIPPEVA